jgi:hypothetical protein
MRNTAYCFKNISLLILPVLVLIAAGCTKHFEEYNTNSAGVTNSQLIPDNNNIGGYYPDIQNSIIPNNGQNSLIGTLGEYLISAPFAGYTSESYPQEGPPLTYNFTGWDGFYFFAHSYNSIMAPVNTIRKQGTPSSSPDFWAIALILQVAEMHKITDIYGPIPFSKYGAGGTSVAYDSQQDIYTALFAELDTAVTNLKTFIATYPGSTPFARFDRVYSGDYTKWLKYANSLRLRLAMHIVKKDPVTAEAQALKAIDPADGGVFASNADNAIIHDGGNNYLGVVCNSWDNARAGASVISYMTSYNDPRLSQYFERSKFPGGPYIGLKTGAIVHSLAEGNMFSTVSFKNFDPLTGLNSLMNFSEVQFLLAEGALRGWNMGGTAKEYYEAGITSSMNQWGVGDKAADYINDASSRPQPYTDPLEPLNNSPALSTSTVKWDEGATQEEKLERIITQKWIAIFPDGTESWANFRRTGYPRLFPVTASQNHSNGTIDTDIQIRRAPYPTSEYASNKTELEKGILLLGGPDNGGTRVWWDVNGPNF